MILLERIACAIEILKCIVRTVTGNVELTTNKLYKQGCYLMIKLAVTFLMNHNLKKISN